MISKDNKVGKVGFSSRGKYYMHMKDFLSDDKSFEGKLTFFKREVKKDDGNLKNQTLYSYHTFEIQKGNKKRRFIFRGHQEIDFTHHFCVGDMVRHFSGHEIPEKYDKSQDTKILCIECGDFSPMNQHHCQYCGGLLL